MAPKKEILLIIVLTFISITVMIGGMLFIQEGNISQALNFSILFSVLWIFAVGFSYYFLWL